MVKSHLKTKKKWNNSWFLHHEKAPYTTHPYAVWQF